MTWPRPIRMESCRPALTENREWSNRDLQREGLLALEGRKLEGGKQERCADQV